MNDKMAKSYEDDLIELLQDQIIQIKVATSNSKSDVIKDLKIQLADLTIRSKIELGDDVIVEIERLQKLIKLNK